ncbi:MAG: hypothetical protein ACLR0U_32250 [Enterocloster clostridioformis]
MLPQYGYWRGIGLFAMLDILGSVLTDGIGAAGMDQRKGYGSCGGCSQVMIVVDPGRTTTDAHMKEIVDTAVRYVKARLRRRGGGVGAPGRKRPVP